MSKTAKSTQGMGLHGTKVFLRHLGDDPQDYAWTQADAWVEAMLADKLQTLRKVGQKAAFSARITRQGKSFLLDGQLEVAFSPQCDRCSKDYSDTLEESFQLMLMPPSAREGLLAKPNRTAKQEKRQQRASDDDEEPGWGTSDGEMFEDESSVALPGEDVDLSDIFAEQTVLALPMSYHCQENCPGLCPQCGADLSVSRCNCKEEHHDDRWQALKNIKIKT